MDTDLWQGTQNKSGKSNRQFKPPSSQQKSFWGGGGLVLVLEVWVQD